MTDVSLEHVEVRPVRVPPWAMWAAAALLLFGVAALSHVLPSASDYPDSWIVPFNKWIGAIFLWLKANFTWATRAVAAVIDVPLDFAMALLAKGFKLAPGPDAATLPRLSWLGVCAVMASLGYAYGGRRLALLCGLGFFSLALFGLWDQSMLTLALIVICVPICVAVGLLAGIWSYRSPRADRYFVTPALDLMQTMPTFAYLIPILIFFGNSPVSALLATGLFATPPMVRATILGLKKVPQEIKDFADMAGCTRRQKLWRVLVPAAKPSLMIGVNQVIMLALNMVIISSMIGAGGLGYDVLLALRALKVGHAMEAGLAIVILAIVLDRLSQAVAHQSPETRSTPGNWFARNSNVSLAIGLLAVTTILSPMIPALAKFPASLTVTTAPLWKAVVDWMTVNLFDTIEVMRVGLLLYFLNPLRAIFESIPWLGLTLLVALLGWRLGGRWLALGVALSRPSVRRPGCGFRPCRRSISAVLRRLWPRRSAYPSDYYAHEATG